VGKHSQKTRRLKPVGARTSTASQKSAAGRSRGLWLAAGAAGLLVVVVIGAAIAFAAGFASSNPGSLPSGTQVFAETDHSHVEGSVSYDRVPPAGGPHNPLQLNCGVYSDPVPNENAVHSLEHGAVWITYQPTLPADQIAALQNLVTASYVGPERYLILSPYSGIPSPIVASAWGAQLGVDQVSDSRLIDFIHHFAGGGQGGEQGGPCTGGVGSPVA
jgi:hypothetical protein